jgi:hypothetical protein
MKLGLKIKLFLDNLLSVEFEKSFKLGLGPNKQLWVKLKDSIFLYFQILPHPFTMYCTHSTIL